MAEVKFDHVWYRRVRLPERKAEENRRITAAVEAEANGDRAGAEAILNEPPPDIVVTVKPEIAKVDGVNKPRDNWSVAVFDMDALARHADPALLLPNYPALNSLARAFKGALNIPGVRAVNNPSRAVRCG